MNNVRLLTVTFMLLVMANLAFSQQSKLHIYGFFDFEFEGNNKDEAGKKWTFDQHHLNLLATYLIDERFRVTTEIEWEHGPMHSPSESVGNIYLAKAFLEYKYSDALLVRGGKFMSPFGIYNERHDATPTFLSTFLPRSVYGKQELSFGGKGRLFAKHSTGLQILGNYFFDGWGLKYQVYVSNGRGPMASERDNNANKGIGWRFVISLPVEDLHFGSSYYKDKNGDANNAEHTALGFDVEYDLSDLHVEAEYLLATHENVDTTGVPIGTFSNLNGYYILGGYTLFDRLTPFIRYEFFDPDLDQKNDGESIIVAGLNYALSNSVYLKGEVHFHRFQDKSVKKYEMFVSSVAVAF